MDRRVTGLGSYHSGPGKNKSGGTIVKSKILPVALAVVSALLFAAVGANARGGTEKVGALAETQSRSVATNLGLFGSSTWDIEKDPTSAYIYLATKSPNGFFGSANGGQTWFGLPAGADYGQGADVEVNPTNGHVYALLSSLIISTDHGATFKEISSLDGESLNASSLLYENGRLFLGRDNGTVAVSTDEGESFSTSTLSAGVPILSLAGVGSTVYALSKNRYSANSARLFKSSDNGATWADLGAIPGSAEDVTKVVVNPNNSYVFLLPGSEGTLTYRSTDGGASFALIAAPVTGYMSFDGGGRTYVGWNYSTDNGNTWLPLGSGGGSFSHYVVPDPGNDNILYDGAMPGFSKSTDRGATWTSSVEGITAVTTTSISQATDKDIVWVATQNGLAKTTNFLSGSPTWTYPIAPTANFTSAGKDSVWVDPDNPSSVVFGTSATIWRSSDGGSSWSQATTDISLNGTVAHEITSNADGSTIYAAVGRSANQGTAGGVLRSTDAGATWTSTGFPGNAAALSVTVADDGDILAGAGSNTGSVKGLYKYSGGAWSKLGAPDYDIAAVLSDPEVPNTIYALATKTPSDAGVGFYKSTDDGVTFRHITSGLGNAYEFGALAIQRSTRPNTLYVSALDNMSGRIYKSGDDGKTWT
ncbi:hypothetical protein LCGC14_1788560, partial [marine sediment metagenome]